MLLFFFFFCPISGLPQQTTLGSSTFFSCRHTTWLDFDTVPSGPGVNNWLEHLWGRKMHTVNSPQAVVFFIGPLIQSRYTLIGIVTYMQCCVWLHVCCQVKIFSIWKLLNYLQQPSACNWLWLALMAVKWLMAERIHSTSFPKTLVKGSDRYCSCYKASTT